MKDYVFKSVLHEQKMEENFVGFISFGGLPWLIPQDCFEEGF